MDKFFDVLPDKVTGRQYHELVALQAADHRNVTLPTWDELTDERRSHYEMCAISTNESIDLSRGRSDSGWEVLLTPLCDCGQVAVWGHPSGKVQCRTCRRQDMAKELGVYAARKALNLTRLRELAAQGVKTDWPSMSHRSFCPQCGDEDNGFGCKKCWEKYKETRHEAHDWSLIRAY